MDLIIVTVSRSINFGRLTLLLSPLSLLLEPLCCSTEILYTVAEKCHLMKKNYNLLQSRLQEKDYQRILSFDLFCNSPTKLYIYLHNDYYCWCF